MELLLYHYPILGPGLETQTGVFGSEIRGILYLTRLSSGRQEAHVLKTIVGAEARGD